MEVTYQSGVSRLFNSVIAAFCLAPLLLLVTTFVLGFNEKRDVCDSRAIDAGADTLTKVGCTDPLEGDGQLVYFNCDLKSAVVDLSSINLGDFASKLPSVLSASGFQIQASMKQCVEQSSRSTSKDKVGGGTTTVTVYKYQTEWRDTPIGNSFAHKNDPAAQWNENCGADNPPWPAGLPTSTTKYASTAKIGVYDVSGSYVQAIPLAEPALEPADTPSKEWRTIGCEGGAQFCKTAAPANPNGIGDVRISFVKTDWNHPAMSVLGENNRGTISQWVAPDSWMCSGTTIGELKTGTIPQDQFMQELADSATAITWLLRLVGFCLAWFAFSLMAKPLGAAADCLPCIGPCLGDMVEAVACAISVCPACGCTLLVAGIVWVFMRPLKGILFMLTSIGIFAGLAFYRAKRNQRVVALKGGLMA